MKRLITLLLLSLLFAVNAANLDEIAVFPADFQNGKYSFNENHISPLSVSFLGKGSVLAAAKKTQLVLRLPEFLELVAVHSTHPSHAEMFDFVAEGDTVKIGLPPRYLKNIFEKNFPWQGGINLYFRAKPGTAGQRGSIGFAMIADGKQEALTKTIQVTSTEPLPPVYRKLNKFKIGNWRSHAMASPDRKLFEESLRFWTNLCDRPFYMLGNPDFAIKDKTRVAQILKEFETIYLMATALDTIVPLNSKYGFNDGGKITRPNVPRLLGANGKVRNPLSICPQYLINDPENIFWDKHIVEGVQKILDMAPGVKGICLNYENIPGDATCDACRAEFARQEKLSKIPSRDEIREGKPLHIQWRKFRARQRTQIIKRYYETLKKNFPGLSQWMCTVNLRPGQDPIMGWSGIDPRSYSPYTDYFNSMLYCAGKQYADMLFCNLKGVKKPLYPVIDPAETELRWFVRYTPDTVRQNIVITAAAGCKGMSLYPSDYFDASYLTMFCDTFNAVAEAEDAYEKPSIADKLQVKITNSLSVEMMRGDKPTTVTFPNMEGELKTFLHHDGTSYYATLLNYSDISDIFCRVSIPDYQGDGKVVDLLSRRKYTEVDADLIRKGFLVKLPPNGTLLLKFGPYAHTRGVLPQQQLIREENASLQELKTKAEFLKPQTNGKRIIQWVIGRSGKPVIQFCDRKAKIEFDPLFGGIITEWRIPGIGQCVPGRFRGDNGFGDLQFHEPNPAIPKTIPFKLDKLYFQDGNAFPAADMSYTIQVDLDAGGKGNPLEKLKIDRKNILTDSMGSFQVVHTFTNQSGKPMTFGFRLKTFPIYRWKPNDGLKASLSDGTEIPCGIQTYVKTDKKVQWEHIGSPKTLDDLTVTIRHSKLPLYYKIKGDFDGLYCWSDHMQQTVEPLTSTFTLEPGQSRTFTLYLDVVDERKR